MISTGRAWRQLGPSRTSCRCSCCATLTGHGRVLSLGNSHSPCPCLVVLKQNPIEKKKLLCNSVEHAALDLVLEVLSAGLEDFEMERMIDALAEVHACQSSGLPAWKWCSTDVCEAW